MFSYRLSEQPGRGTGKVVNCQALSNRRSGESERESVRARIQSGEKRCALPERRRRRRTSMPATGMRHIIIKPNINYNQCWPFTTIITVNASLDCKNVHEGSKYFIFGI